MYYLYWPRTTFIDNLWTTFNNKLTTKSLLYSNDVFAAIVFLSSAYVFNFEILSYWCHYILLFLHVFDFLYQNIYSIVNKLKEWLEIPPTWPLCGAMLCCWPHISCFLRRCFKCPVLNCQLHSFVSRQIQRPGKPLNVKRAPGCSLRFSKFKSS